MRWRVVFAARHLVIELWLSRDDFVRRGLGVEPDDVRRLLDALAQLERGRQRLADERM